MSGNAFFSLQIPVKKAICAKLASWPSPRSGCMPKNMISILGDSRVFDTYYYNASYPQGYGYDKTFPFLLRERLLSAGNGLDLAHIPDHFRAGTPANNILRLAFTDPAAIVLCNGIWETLVNKGHFLEYVEAELGRHSTASGERLDFSYSSGELARLFVQGRLSNSPARYAERQRTIISYFRRRRRQAVNISLPMPPADHLDRVHYAGNHKLIPEWDACLDALNKAVAPVLEAYGAHVLDAHALMQASGGPSACLIDQWHFSPLFHAGLAEALEAMLPAVAGQAETGPGHISHRFMVPGCGLAEPVAVYGREEQVREFAAGVPEGMVAAVYAPGEEERLSDPAADAVILALPPEERAEAETGLLAILPRRAVLVYPEEALVVDNPHPGRSRPEG